MLTPEGHEKKAIKKYLDSIGAWHFSPTTAGFGKSGVPDIVACIRGAFVGVEVKREGKKPTPRQRRIIEALADSGGLVLWGTADKVLPELKGIFER